MIIFNTFIEMLMIFLAEPLASAQLREKAKAEDRGRTDEHKREHKKQFFEIDRKSFHISSRSKGVFGPFFDIVRPPTTPTLLSEKIG